jgi:hypothetical protein
MKPRPHKRPPSEYNSTPLKEESLRKRPYSHIGHQEEFKDDMSSDVIEGEPLDVLSEPIFQPILYPDDPSYALSPKSHDDPRNPLRQPIHRNHEDYKDG